MGISIVRTEWSGTSGGPGLTQMCIDAFDPISPSAAQSWVNAVRSFWSSLGSLLPNELTLTVDPQVDVYNVLDGELESSVVAATPPAPVVGSSAASYAGGAGVKVSWETGQIKFGRRVRGSTFIVPISAAVFGGTGEVLPASQTTINTAAASLLAALDSTIGGLTVWSRPRVTPTARAGFATEVTAGICSTKSAILRSRRD